MRAFIFSLRHVMLSPLQTCIKKISLKMCSIFAHLQIFVQSILFLLNTNKFFLSTLQNYSSLGLTSLPVFCIAVTIVRGISRVGVTLVAVTISWIPKSVSRIAITVAVFESRRHNIRCRWWYYYSARFVCGIPISIAWGDLDL